MVGVELTPTDEPGRPAPGPSQPQPRWLTRGAMVSVALLAVGGTAAAFWAASGHGGGAAATETAGEVSLSPGSPVAQLYPGSSADVVLEISNPNRASVHVGSLALDTAMGTLGFSADPGHAACDLASLGFTVATNGGAGWTVPGALDGAPGTSAVTLPDALAMSVDAPNPCQGAAVTIHLSAAQ